MIHQKPVYTPIWSLTRHLWLIETMVYIGHEIAPILSALEAIYMIQVNS